MSAAGHEQKVRTFNFNFLITFIKYEFKHIELKVKNNLLCNKLTKKRGSLNTTPNVVPRTISTSIIYKNGADKTVVGHARSTCSILESTVIQKPLINYTL